MCGMADNRHFDLVGIDLGLSLEVAFSDRHKAVGWAEMDTPDKPTGPGGVWGANRASKRLVLFWTPDEVMTPLPAPLGIDDCIPFVTAWLNGADYGREPDHDGSNRKGWRVYNEEWGHVAGRWQAFAAVEPVWLLIGK